MSLENGSPPRKWFAVAAAFAIAAAGLVFWSGKQSRSPDDRPDLVVVDEPVLLPTPPPIRDRSEFQPPPSEKPRSVEPEMARSEADPPFSSGGGGFSTPNKSVVLPLPSLWSLLFRSWLLVVAGASIAILGGWQWKRRRKAP